MKIVPLRSDPRPEHAHHVCNMCGKPSEITICDECSERLRMEALAKKKHEEQGNACLTGNRLATLEHCCGIWSAGDEDRHVAFFETFLFAWTPNWCVTRPWRNIL
jgi:hypothetical protein